MELRVTQFAFISVMSTETYHRRSNGHTDSQIHFVLVRYRHRSYMLLIRWANGDHTSAALPTMGKTINPINVVDTPDEATIASIELTRNSAQTATTAVLASNRPHANSGVISATSSGSPSDPPSGLEPGSSDKYACVLSWKKRYLCR